MEATPNPVYLTFAGTMDQQATSRLFNTLAIATQQKVTEIHLLWQTSGGNVSEGVVLYSYFKEFPVPMHIYNAGSVSSAGVVAFAGARHRYANDHATFMIHRTYLSGVAGVHSHTLHGLAESAALDDERTTAILRSSLKMPDESWIAHQYARDVSFGASKALEFGLVHEIKPFRCPEGAALYNI